MFARVNFLPLVRDGIKKKGQTQLRFRNCPGKDGFCFSLMKEVRLLSPLSWALVFLIWKIRGNTLRVVQKVRHAKIEIFCGPALFCHTEYQVNMRSPTPSLTLSACHLPFIQSRGGISWWPLKSMALFKFYSILSDLFVHTVRFVPYCRCWLRCQRVRQSHCGQQRRAFYFKLYVF